jgi:hypothetical protein
MNSFIWHPSHTVYHNTSALWRSICWSNCHTPTCLAIYHVHNVFQVCAMQSLVHVFPGQVQHISTVMSVWGSSWHLSLAGISFLSTQLASSFKLSTHRVLLFVAKLCLFMPSPVWTSVPEDKIYSLPVAWLLYYFKGWYPQQMSQYHILDFILGWGVGGGGRQANQWTNQIFIQRFTAVYGHDCSP